MNKDPVPQKHCEQCGDKMSGRDKHSSCLFCLGFTHADNAVNAPGGCKACASTEKKYLLRRLAHLQEQRNPTPGTSGAADSEEEDISDVAVQDWGEHMDEENPVQDLELQIQDYEFDPIYDLNENPFDIVDVYDAPEEGELDGYGDEDSHVLPADDAAPQAAAAQDGEAARGNAGGELPAAAAGADNPGAQLTVDMSDIQDIFRNAARRCNATWPQEEQAQAVVDEEGVFRPLGAAAEKPQGRGVLPAVKGFYTNLQASWEKPKSCIMPDARRPDCADMKQNGLEGLPPVDGAMATHLLK